MEGVKTWEKIARDSQKTGYRDGANDGRNSKFQESFDDGFQQGFLVGYNLGKTTGIIRACQRQLNNEPPKDALLEKINRGWCQICPTQDVSNVDINEAKVNQVLVTNRYLGDLSGTYKSFVNVNLPEKL